MKLAESDEARKRYQIAFTRRGGEKNLLLLKQAIDLRYDLARLMGKSSYADWVLENRMGENAEKVNQFLAEVYATVSPLEKRKSKL